jgi:serpin B
MLVMVPASGAFAAFESSLNASKLKDIMAVLVAQPVDVALPRFRNETSQDFKTILDSLGMHAAFQPGAADFSGMDGSQTLYITQVLHKAFIDLGEKGTEAAAATAVVVGRLAVDVPSGLTIRADRPFIYVLRDEPTGAILFMGRVLDPNQT